MTDFPAAHSMDTAWFAIDNDGNVALFSSGEAGAVPEQAYIGDDAYELEDHVRTLPAHGFKLDPDGARATQWGEHLGADENMPPETQLYMFLSDLVPVSDLLARLDPRALEATTGKAVLLTARDPAALAEIHARDACLGCYRDWSDHTMADIASHGIYRYEHTCENWIAGPYARAAVPAKPLSIFEIPKAIREKAIAFDGRFADTPKLQPAEHWECTSWEAGWLSSDGKTARPFPDHEDWEHGDNDGEIEFLDEPLKPAKPPKKRWWK